MTWQPNMPDSLFDVTRFENRNGVISWRVSGWLHGLRVRENFKFREEAGAEIATLEPKAAQAAGNVRGTSTFLSDDQLRGAEASFIDARDVIEVKETDRDRAAGIRGRGKAQPAEGDWLAVRRGTVDGKGARIAAAKIDGEPGQVAPKLRDVALGHGAELRPAIVPASAVAGTEAATADET